MKEPNIAVLWDSEVDREGDKPFKKDFINSSYEVFSELGEERDANIVIGKFSWYEDGGMRKAYSFKDGEWNKIENVGLEGIFDKFKFDDETIPIKKEMHSSLPVLNNYKLEEICKDKLLTYEEFPEAVPETREATEENVKEMLAEYNQVVLKPRYDFGGKGVRVIDSIDEYESEENLLVQRFIDSSTGIPQLGINGVHDLRVIVVNGENSTSFVRTPEEGLISNVSRGGSMHHIDINDVPKSALNVVEDVEQVFAELGNRVYAVDFIFDQNREPWILEMNSKPGLVFYDDPDVREWKEPLMEKVVDALVDMVN